MCSFAHICRHYLGKMHVPYKSLPDHWTSPTTWYAFGNFLPFWLKRRKKPTDLTNESSTRDMRSHSKEFFHVQCHKGLGSLPACKMWNAPFTHKTPQVKTDAFTQHKSHFIRTVCFHHDIIQPDSGYYQIQTRLQHKANNDVNMSPHVRYSWLWPSLCVEYCPGPWLKPSLLLKQILQYIIFVLTS